ncbi:MAG: o-succinylbenzoate synthase [Actinomycetota bacterium]|nr:o-succinylbenzoate synthase [Actinomycetota bacterium]
MRVFRVPLRARFRGVDHREGVLLRGPAGWGEFSPFPDYDSRVAARWLAAAREASQRPWPTPLRERIPVNVTVPAVPPEQAHAIVTASGCATAKVKVAEPNRRGSEDLARVEAVRDALGRSGRLRIDANGAWDVDTAARMLRVLGRFDLEYAEQPVATLQEMAVLRGRVDVPLAADESIRTAQDPLRVVGLAAADVVVLKVQPLGGVWPALRVAEAAGLPAVVSSAVETSIGIAAGLALAAALPELPYACGLATVQLLTGDVVAEPLLPVDGVIPLRRPPVAPEALAPYELHGPDAEAWQRRLTAAQRSGTRAVVP